MPFTKSEIDMMTTAEKRELLEILWESIEEEKYVDNAEEETEEEKSLLRERLDDYHKNSRGINWETLKDKLSKPDHD